jgi:uridine phosphorylase
VWEATAGGRRIVLVQGCLWGGPQAAILVEELACLGVRDVIGSGVAGSLVESMPKGTQIVGAGGIVIDTTSRAYTSADRVAPDPALLDAAVRVAEAHGIALSAAQITGVDALYRETPDDVRRWLALGADAVNMETPVLYASSAVCGMRALWLGHVSDRLSLTAQHWESWQRPAALTDITVALTVALLEHLPSAAS